MESKKQKGNMTKRKWKHLNEERKKIRILSIFTSFSLAHRHKNIYVEWRIDQKRKKKDKVGVLKVCKCKMQYARSIKRKSSLLQRTKNKTFHCQRNQNIFNGAISSSPSHSTSSILQISFTFDRSFSSSAT